MRAAQAAEQVPCAQRLPGFTKSGLGCAGSHCLCLSLAHGQITSWQFLVPPLLFKLQYDQEWIMIHFSSSLSAFHLPPSSCVFKIRILPCFKKENFFQEKN